MVGEVERWNWWTIQKKLFRRAFIECPVRWISGGFDYRSKYSNGCEINNRDDRGRTKKDSIWKEVEDERDRFEVSEWIMISLLWRLVSLTLNTPPFLLYYRRWVWWLRNLSRGYVEGNWYFRNRCKCGASSEGWHYTEVGRDSHGRVMWRCFFFFFLILHQSPN